MIQFKESVLREALPLLVQSCYEKVVYKGWHASPDGMLYENDFQPSLDRVKFQPKAFLACVGEAQEVSNIRCKCYPKSLSIVEALTDQVKIAGLNSSHFLNYVLSSLTTTSFHALRNTSPFNFADFLLPIFHSTARSRIRTNDTG